MAGLATAPFDLIGLPPELRAMILAYLLPNKEKVVPLWETSRWRMDHWNKNVPEEHETTSPPDLDAQLRYDGDQCHTAILRASHQLYQEGTVIIYNREFILTHFTGGLCFLRWDGPIAAMSEIPEFPFHKARQLTIRIAYQPFYAAISIPYSLGRICKHIATYPSLKDVRVLFDTEDRDNPRKDWQPKLKDTLKALERLPPNMRRLYPDYDEPQNPQQE
ncbi:MAG: hypothetical protein Q9213_000691 [Squamulea squamosa]